MTTFSTEVCTSHSRVESMVVSDVGIIGNFDRGSLSNKFPLPSTFQTINQLTLKLAQAGT